MINQDLINQLSKLKEETEESKTRLEQMRISEESGGGLIRVSMNGNRELIDIEVNAPLKEISKEELEDLLSVAFKRTMEKVNNVNESEVMNSAKNLFPGL